MGDKPDHPTHSALIESRDQSGTSPADACFGGAPWQSGIRSRGAQRLERYANSLSTVCASAGSSATGQAKVRAFLLKFPDRVLYGTDVVQRQPVSALEEPERRAHLASMRQRYVLDLAYFSSDATTSCYGVDTKGLGLPPDVAAAVMGGNAREWYPGV